MNRHAHLSRLSGLNGLGGLGRVLTRTTVDRAERRPWAQAATLGELGALTGLWLQGRLRTQPGYVGSVDVDEALAPGLADVLVACNRAGFLTRASQAADQDQHSPGRWVQLAAVEGHAEERVVRHLRSALRGTRFRIQARPPARIRPAGVVVTRYDGRPATTYGRATRAEIAASLTGAGPGAIRDVLGALYVVVWDPEPGHSTDLWDVLQAAVAPLIAQEPGLTAADRDNAAAFVLEHVRRPVELATESGLIADGDRMPMDPVMRARHTLACLTAQLVTQTDQAAQSAQSGLNSTVFTSRSE
jgi:hypothetical protein